MQAYYLGELALGDHGWSNNLYLVLALPSFNLRYLDGLEVVKVCVMLGAFNIFQLKYGP